MSDPLFRRIGSWCAFAIAVLSILYAVVHLGFVRPNPANASASAMANGLIGLSGVLATFAAIAVGDRVGGSAGRWIGVVGVGWALLSAVHGTFGAIADAQGIDIAGMRPDFAPTDPRGFATFGLAGLWSIVLGAAVSSGGTFPRAVGTIALINGVDLIVLFFATAAGVGPLVLITGGLAAVILGPIQWAWIGRSMR